MGAEVMCESDALQSRVTLQGKLGSWLAAWTLRATGGGLGAARCGPAALAASRVGKRCAVLAGLRDLQALEVEVECRAATCRGVQCSRAAVQQTGSACSRAASSQQQRARPRRAPGVV